MVENSLGAHGVRERPELVGGDLPYRLERAPTSPAGRRRRTRARRSTHDRAPTSPRRRSCCRAARTPSSIRATPTCSSSSSRARALELVPDRGHLMHVGGGRALAPIVKEFLSRERRHTLGRWIRDRARDDARARRDRLRRGGSSPTASSTRRSDAFAPAFARARPAARRPRRDADGQLARARDGLLRVREGRPHAAAALVAARRARAALPARGRRAGGLPRRGRVRGARRSDRLRASSRSRPATPGQTPLSPRSPTTTGCS